MLGGGKFDKIINDLDCAMLRRAAYIVVVMLILLLPSLQMSLATSNTYYTRFSPPYTFHSGEGVYNIYLTALNDTRFVVCYEASDFFFRVGTLSGGAINFGSEITFDRGFLHSIAALDSTHIVILYDTSEQGWGATCIGTISGDTITFGDEYVFENVGEIGDAQIDALNSTHFVIAYAQYPEDADYVRACIGIVSDGGISYSEIYDVYTADIENSNVLVTSLSSTQFVIAYSISAEEWCFKVGTVSDGNTIAFGDEITIQAVAIYAMDALDDTHIVIAYAPYEGERKCRIGTISDNTITFGNEYEIDDQDILPPYVCALNSTNFIVAYANGTTHIGKAKCGTVSGDTISFGSAGIFSNHAHPPVVSALNDTYFVIAYPGESAHGKTVIGKTSTVISSVNGISPYWHNHSPVDITASTTDDSLVTNVSLYYRFSSDNSTWSDWTLYGTDTSPPWEWTFDFPDGEGYYEFYSSAYSTTSERPWPPAIADTIAGYDTTPPSSSVNPISPYWQYMYTMTITATSTDSLSGTSKLQLYYRYSSDNSTWSDWTLYGTDTSPPWEWTFDFPDGEGYYEFYSIATDNAENQEEPPATADAKAAHAEYRPSVSNPRPPDGATDVSTFLSQLSVDISDAYGNLMSWTIETSPDIGSAYGNNAENGTITCPISGLQCGITYTWYVNVTNGHHWTNKTYTFTTMSLANWQYRKKLTISNAVNEYQMRIKVYKNDGHDNPSAGEIDTEGHCKDDFGDIRFTDSEDNELPYWIEEKEDGNYAIIWVKLPSNIESQSEKYIYMHYGNPSATATSDGSAVWDFYEEWTADYTGEYTEVKRSGYNDFGHYRAISGISIPYRQLTKLKIHTWDYDKYGSTAVQGTSNDKNDHTPKNGIFTEWSCDTDAGAGNSTVAWRIRVSIDGNGYSSDWQTYSFTLDTWYKNEIKVTSSQVSAAVYTEDYSSTLAYATINNVPSSTGTYNYYGEYTSDTYGPGKSWAYHGDPDYCIGYGGYRGSVSHIELYSSWTCIGKYADPEPTWSSFGSEEITDNTPPTSNIDPILQYWFTNPATITATASDDKSGVDTVKLYYRFSLDNTTWSDWTLYGTDTDGSDGWKWTFDFPDGMGYYQFYSIATDKAGNTESKTTADIELGKPIPCYFTYSYPVNKQPILFTDVSAISTHTKWIINGVIVAEQTFPNGLHLPFNLTYTFNISNIYNVTLWVYNETFDVSNTYTINLPVKRNLTLYLSPNHIGINYVAYHLNTTISASELMDMLNLHKGEWIHKYNESTHKWMSLWKYNDTVTLGDNFDIHPWDVVVVVISNNRTITIDITEKVNTTQTKTLQRGYHYLSWSSDTPILSCDVTKIGLQEGDWVFKYDLQNETWLSYNVGLSGDIFEIKPYDCVVVNLADERTINIGG